ncbi:MAG: SDR family NAD(P)-dependent oxidoreductase [Gammaproteobacteria bacterium]|nr:SDR family NAD(P)-dependent oxidoreductase [Gammaproteobacteria bacterium]
MQSALEKFSLKGRTAVVTGGSRGLGYDLARILAAAGAKVLISARSEPALKQAAETLGREENADVMYATVDLADRDSVKQFAEVAQKLLGQVDIFVANAAMDARTLVDTIDEEILAPLVNTNLDSNVILTKLFADGMKQRGWGRIIYISSTATVRTGHFGTGYYGATKAALEAYARAVSVELGPYGITANSVLPGAYFTEMVEESFASMGEEKSKPLLDSISSMTSLGRWGKPEELAGAVLLFASDAGSYITGQSLAVCGGLSIKKLPTEV